MEYTVNLPEIMEFGCKVRFRLPEFLLPGPVLIVCGKHAVAEIETELLPLLSGREVRIFSDIAPELPLHQVETLAKFAADLKIRNFAGLGGGSAMDAAKAAAVLAGNPGPAADYFYGRLKLAKTGNRFIALPTTCGTGAEMTGNSVIRDEATNIKQSLRGPGMTAFAALCDPELLYNAPERVIAASGFDALTQAVESFLSIRSTAASRITAAMAARDLMACLPEAVRGDKAALFTAARSSMLTGMTFAGTSLGMVHGIGHPAGSVTGISHGETCAVLLPNALKWNAVSVPEKLENLARSFALKNTAELIEKIEELRKLLRLPDKLPKLSEKQLDFIVANCRSGSMKTNPRELSDAEVKQFLQELT